MKEAPRFFAEDEFDLLGVVRLENGARTETRYYFRGWIPLCEFAPDWKPEYVMGHSGRETLIRCFGLRPAVKIKVVD